MAATNSKVRIKLLIDTKSNKVLFAEAGKDFVDFLFNLLALPVATVVRLLTKNSLVGSIGNLYASVENLNTTYIQPNRNKDLLLTPQAPPSASDHLPLLLAYGESSTRKVYACSNINHRNYVADDPSLVCTHCNQKMSTEIPFAARSTSAQGKSADEGGFVKGVVTYMVMDDLAVSPMSTISSITLLHKFNVREVGALEERVVDLGLDEGLKLLKFSLQSKSVLTNVFLGNRRA